MAILRTIKAKTKKVKLKEAPYKPRAINFDLPGVQLKPATKNQDIRFDFDKVFNKFKKLTK